MSEGYEAVPYPKNPVRCEAQFQWHEYVTVISEDYTIPGDNYMTFQRQDTAVVCKKCGAVVRPFKDYSMEVRSEPLSHPDPQFPRTD